MTRLASFSDRSVTAAAAIGLGLAGMMVTAFPMLIGDATSSDLVWAALTTVAAAALLVGIVVKASGNRRGVAAGLLVLGSPAPALAWFWLPPVYLVSIAIPALAVVSMAHRPDATAVAA